MTLYLYKENILLGKIKRGNLAYKVTKNGKDLYFQDMNEAYEYYNNSSFFDSVSIELVRI